MTYTFIARRCDDLPVAVCCRVLGVSRAGFYAWRSQPCSDRDRADAELTNTIVDIHRASRGPMGRRGCTPSCASASASAAAAQAGGAPHALIVLARALLAADPADEGRASVEVGQRADGLDVVAEIRQQTVERSDVGEGLLDLLLTRPLRRRGRADGGALPLGQIQ